MKNDELSEGCEKSDQYAFQAENYKQDEANSLIERYGSKLRREDYCKK